MKIKRLELSGFKSFVDRTVIHFDHDVMGIVGPNGCGKSNIVDAIRWCMGEQSAKHLRGRSMEDVIFNGSESRAPSDYAEVTLTFENDDPSGVPLEYRDYADIAVARRLHRSGESEYLINKTQVRLKDITDLFLGTGVGTKAYSIVEQGKIGLIVSAKPEDRRLLIEEAAGITKFKSRKKQAERKMELTQQNLLRVGDIIAEIERTIGSLKRQAAKAERYIAYRGELEDLQLHDAAQRWLEHSGWIQLETREVERLTMAVDHGQTALQCADAELETARQAAHVAESALEEATQRAFATENAVRLEEATIDRARERLESLARRAAQATAEQTEIDAQRVSLATERDEVAKEIALLEDEDAQAAQSLATEESELSRLQEQLADAERVAVERRSELAAAQALIAAAEAKLAGYDRRREDMQARHERVVFERNDRSGLREEILGRSAQLALRVEDLRTGRVVSADEAAALTSSLAELRHQIAESERLLDEAKGEASRARSRLHALTDVQARLEGVGAGTKSLLALKDTAVIGLAGDCVEAPPHLTAALAGLLGARIDEVVVSDIERAAALLAGLAAGGKGRATVLPRRARYVAGVASPAPDAALCRLIDELRYAPEDEAVVRSLVGDALVVATLDDALALRSAVACALVTLDGTVVRADGRIEGGSGDEVAAHRLETQREIRELSSGVHELDDLVSERLAAHQALRHAIGEATGALERARQQAHADELSLVHAEKDHRAALAEIEAHGRALDSLGAELESLTSQLAEADAERESALAGLSAARATAAEATGRIEEGTATATAWREQVEAQRQVLMDRKVRFAGAHEKLTGARGTESRLARSVTELVERHARLEVELCSGAEEMGRLAAEWMTRRESLGQALDALRDAQDAVASTRATFDGHRTEMGELEGRLKDLRAEADAAKEALAAHEMSLREHRIALGHLLAGVRERFRGLALERVVGDYHMRPPPDEVSRARIHELAGLIERMGSVNLDAVSEHDEAEKRYAFYTGQKADLDKALADLDRAIQQMNRESKRLFKETFDAVNERFQEVFPRMFRGGRASLRLTNAEDMLETGIDILAQPPGKKLSSIELMSGGEKALTAVSLIFAIFQIKPSPFCVLDEVDAPLDEANVARYNEVIRSMTASSQFILITHIKRTMQLVDVLHGVTMQEPGVSRLVSVKVSDAAKAGRRASGDNSSAGAAASAAVA